jgi:hypothetical protein
MKQIRIRLPSHSLSMKLTSFAFGSLLAFATSAQNATAGDGQKPNILMDRAGVGGRGMIPTRDNDTFGVGYCYNKIQKERISTFLGPGKLNFRI